MTESHKQKLRNAYYKRPLIRKTCEFCGEEFKTRHNRQKYCSQTCQEKHRYYKKKVVHPDYICQVCGAQFKLTFFPTHDTEKFKNLRCPNCGELARGE